MSPRELSPIANDARKAARARRIADGACGLCGATDPTVLVAVTRSLLEFHHVAGAANDASLGVVLCRNCHALATEAQRDVGVDLRRCDNRHPLERLAAALRSLGSFLALLGERCLAWSDELMDLVSHLDAGLPSWRTVRQGASDDHIA